MKSIFTSCLLALLAASSCRTYDLDFYTPACPVDRRAVHAWRQGGFIIPNGFSPNGDGLNDALRPLISDGSAVSSMLVRIYDAGGKVICTIDSPGQSWDGTDPATGKLCRAAAYGMDYSMQLSGKGLSSDTTISGHACIWLFVNRSSIPSCLQVDDDLIKDITFEDQITPASLSIAHSTAENICP